LKLYLDASVLVALFVADALSSRADSLLKTVAEPPVVTNFAAAEFSSGVARRVRTGEMNVHQARAAFSDFDLWIGEHAERSEINSSDVMAATSLVRRLDLPLRAADALHIAAAQRLGTTLATFDEQMAASAETVGISVRAR
jgi:predicted nucleic acid-binding protein